MRAAEKGVVQSVVLFLGVSALSGALAAGLAIPFAGLAGFGTERASESFEQLPQEMKVRPLPVRSKILDASGRPIANIFEQNRVPVKLKDISPIMKKAVIAIEDSRFYEHGALDAKGTLRALLRNKTEGSVTQGGSSITQQFVKMTLVQQARNEQEARAATEETYERKIKELRYAVAIEKQFSKDEILEKYLNIAYFGDGAYGVEAAARHYFTTTASKLTLEQAAMLAGLVKNPTAYDPTNYMRPAKSRRDLVLRRMQELSIITPQQADKAIKTPVKLKVAHVPNGCANSTYPFFCEYVVAKLLENPELGRTKAERERFIKREGITVQTTIDRDIQAAADQAVKERSNGTDQAVAAITIVEPGSGKVKAMAQSRGYGNNKKAGQTTLNYNTERSYPGGYGGFQNGSTMKAFVLAAAIQKGVPLSYRINSPETIDMTGKVWQTCRGPYKQLAEWKPKNSTKGGNIDLITGTKNSVNTYFIQLSQRIGLCAPSTLATRLGVVNGKTEGNDKIGKPLDQVPAYTLGVGSVTPLMMANAYAAFAARGVYCDPVVIISIKDKAFKEIKTPKADCIPVMRQAHADGVNRVLQEVIRSGTGRSLAIDRPAAGKTGTINENRSVWFIGYTPRLAAASVVSDADPPYQNLIGLRFNGRRLSDASGSGVAGPIWEDAMRAAHKGLPHESFVKPDPKIVQGEMMTLPALGGMNPEDAANVLRAAGFNPEIAGDRVPSEYPEGTVAYTDPRRRDGAPSGSTVVIYVSNGQRSTTEPTTKPTVTIPTRPPCWPPRPNCGRR
jgi:membrane peptidoglycan carboxypeptidase